MKSAQENSGRRLRIQFALNMLTVMFALWVFRLRVGYVEFDGLLLLWVFFPIAALGMGFLLRQRPIAKAILVFSAIYCVVYALYCLPGDEGNNLPLLFVPPSLFIFSFLLVPLIMIFQRWIKELCTLLVSKTPRSIKKENGRH